MRTISFKSLSITAALFTGLFATAAASAQNGYPQPNDRNDPNNYSAPASQSYSQGAQPERYDPNSYDQGTQDDRDYQAGQQAIAEAPPALPDYEQPAAPGDGYIWTPGYWAYGPTGYYWVGGAWVEAPYTGALWTPGYWGYGSGGYLWNVGYWGPTVGFYGGINYGFGYFGTGFYGGYWGGGHFFYNREYSRLGFGSRFYYNQRFGGVGGVHPGGRSFSTEQGRDHYRGGTYNGQRQDFGSNQRHDFSPHPGREVPGREVPGREVPGNVQRTGLNPQPGNYNRGTQQPFSGARPVYQAPSPNRGTYNSGYGSAPTYRPGQPAQQPTRSYGGTTGTYNRQSGPMQSGPQQSYRQPSAPQQSYRQPSAPQPSYHQQQSAPQQSYHSAPSYSGGGNTSRGGFSGGSNGGSHSSGHR